MNFEPVQDYIFLKEVPLSETTESGILLGSDRDEENNMAVVYKLRAGTTLPLLVGQVVLIKRHMFDEIKIKEEKILVGREQGIIAITS